MGFYTTRFVEAVSQEEAGEKAILIVRKELESFCSEPVDQSWNISVDMISDILHASEQEPGSGFVWYPED